MSLAEALALLGAVGAMLGSFASIMGAVALWILSGIKKDIHQLLEHQRQVFRDYIPRTESQGERDKLERRIQRTEGRVDELFTDRTDPNLQPVHRRRSSDFPND